MEKWNAGIIEGWKNENTEDRRQEDCKKREHGMLGGGRKWRGI
jgi:hypothetical protein